MSGTGCPTYRERCPTRKPRKKKGPAPRAARDGAEPLEEITFAYITPK